MKHYNIKKGYVIRDKVHYFDATSRSDDQDIIFQREVYERAKKLVENYDFKKVIDIGCGSGHKLVKYFEKFETIGTDLSDTIKVLENKYPNRRWEVSDFTKKLEEEFDLVIAADIIEHLFDPDELMNFLKNMNFKYVIISTPDRDKFTIGKNGPPNNLYHIREWNFLEFENYIKSFFENVIEHKIVAGQTQYILIKNEL